MKPNDSLSQPESRLLRACLLFLSLFVSVSLACNYPSLVQVTQISPTETRIILPSPQPSPTPHPTIETAPTASPIQEPMLEVPQGKIVYTCQIYRDQRRNQICLMNADGSDSRRLTTADQADHFFASLAPDGLSVVYSANSSGSYQIYEQTLTGELRQVTGLPGSSYAPTISPDGSRIVFTNSLEGVQSIWVMQRDGSRPHPVEPLFQGEGWDPVWSPDSTRILFASDRLGIVQLFSMGMDGANLHQVTQMEGIRGRNDWSPDGSTLATYAGGSWVWEIYLMASDGSDLRAITQGGSNLAPSFSPDGKWVTFTSYRDRYQDPNGCEIYTMRTDGTQITRLTDNTFCDWQPRWGP